MLKSNNRIISNLLFLNVLTGLAGTVIAFILFSLEKIYFLPWTHYISEMSAGPNGAGIIFIVMMIIMASAGSLFFILSIKPLQQIFNNKAIPVISAAVGLIGSIDIMVMIFFPLDALKPQTYETHVITGATLFACMSVYQLLYGLLFIRKKGFFRLGGLSALLSSPLCLTFAILLPLAEIADVIKAGPAIYLVEWTAFVLFIGWMIFTALGIRKEKNKADISY